MQHNQAQKSLKAELKTVESMVDIFCLEHHAPHARLCLECQNLLEYARGQLAGCPWGEDKPVCARCSIHFYAPAYRDPIREVMRFAGPRMLFTYPWLALRHLFHTLRPSKI